MLTTMVLTYCCMVLVLFGSFFVPSAMMTLCLLEFLVSLRVCPDGDVYTMSGPLSTHNTCENLIYLMPYLQWGCFFPKFCFQVTEGCRLAKQLSLAEHLMSLKFSPLTADHLHDECWPEAELVAIYQDTYSFCGWEDILKSLPTCNVLKCLKPCKIVRHNYPVI